MHIQHIIQPQLRGCMQSFSHISLASCSGMNLHVLKVSLTTQNIWCVLICCITHNLNATLIQVLTIVNKQQTIGRISCNYGSLTANAFKNKKWNLDDSLACICYTLNHSQNRYFSLTSFLFGIHVTRDFNRHIIILSQCQ